MHRLERREELIHADDKNNARTVKNGYQRESD